MGILKEDQSKEIKNKEKRNSKRMKTLYSLLFIIILCTSSFTQTSDIPNYDWKLHNVGNLWQVVTNRGGLNAAFDPIFDYPGRTNTEWPAGSGNEHVTNSGIWVAAIMDSVRSVTLADGESGNTKEMRPTSEPWDTVWVVGRREVVDIPYWQGYEGVSDQDFVCRYTDYGPASLQIPDHRPLGIEIIQTSYAWASYPLDEAVVVNWHIVFHNDLEDVWLGVYMNGNVGNSFMSGFGYDDETWYNEKEDIMLSRDIEGGPDGDGTTVGQKYYPPKNGGKLEKTFIWWNGVKGAPPDEDRDKYFNMARGEIMMPQIGTGDGTKSMVAFGPYPTVNAGDTLVFSMAILCGLDEQEIVGKGDYIDLVKDRGYKIPSPPPAPEPYLTTDNKEVTIRWEPRPGVTNPEEFEDPYRSDGILKPFEGYRIYKRNDPQQEWTLLAQYDVDNEYGQNTGLYYTYTDVGLLNNIDYFYTVTAYTRPDEAINFPELESSKLSTELIGVPGTAPPETVGKVAVVPNPYRGDIAYESYSPPWEAPPPGENRPWMEQDRKIQFINLPNNCEIRIYTLNGEEVEVIRHESTSRGYENWNLTSRVGQAVSSGIYLFTVEDLNTGEVQVDKFVIIK